MRFDQNIQSLEHIAKLESICTLSQEHLPFNGIMMNDFV